MIRKTILGLTAIAALGVAALAPTSASAWGWGHHGWGYGFYGPGYVNYASDCYLVKKVYRSGAVRMVRVCE